MEKNKNQLQEDAFLKKYLKEIALDTPKSDFTNAIMDTILAEEKKSIVKSEPLISKQMWLLSMGFIGLCLWFLLKGNTAKSYKLPEINFSFLNGFELPTLFENTSISSTILYAIVVFSILVFIQIGYLKNHFNKQFE